MTEINSPPDKPLAAVAAMTAYVSRWPLRHIYGGNWLRDRFATSLSRVGPNTVAKTYGLYFRDSAAPPKVDDLVFVTLMQMLVLLALGGLGWSFWMLSGDWAIGMIAAFSVFYAVPTQKDFLTEGQMADRVPIWLKPITSALSFIVTLPAMLVAIPVALIWGMIGAARYHLSKSGAT